MAEETLSLVTIEPTVALIDTPQPTVELGTLQTEIGTPGSSINLEAMGYAYDRLETIFFTNNQLVQSNVATFLNFADKITFGPNTTIKGNNFVNISPWIKDLPEASRWDFSLRLQYNADPSGDRFAAISVYTYIPSNTNLYDIFLETKILVSKNIGASQLGVSTVDCFRLNSVAFDQGLTHIIRVSTFQNSPVPLTISTGEFTIAARWRA